MSINQYLICYSLRAPCMFHPEGDKDMVHVTAAAVTSEIAK